MPQHPVLLLARADNGPVPTAFQQGQLNSSDPFGTSRHIAVMHDDGIAAGTLQLGGTLAVEQYPFTEMLVVHRGVITLQGDTQPVEVHKGQAVVIGRGTPLRITASPDSLCAFCTATLANGDDKPGIFPIDARAVLAPSASLEPAVLIGPAPQCRANNLFEDSASPLRIGVWDSTPYARIARAHKVHELMHVLEGTVVLTDAEGNGLTVAPGDTVFVSKGTVCAWTSTVYVRKYYAVD
ncbi:cupin domain-containing protein [Pseudomonas sp. PSKL.D1]|uniref:cupin domain-containing protein n=1 Tax=Pseudomonas sp. PSKL.D1 TaxID=3029060 RepID=UPI0023815C0E|nr:cupin domain-containing protein [Pseudomonas sp. PSKL.D1]WDY56810.1 cupin domain-containing protein [Pseudomonas sp. PSKL.D1]